MKPERARVLCVEDDAKVLRLIKARLERDGCEVEIATSVAQAETAYRRGKPDLVLLDVGLPDGSGLDVCRSIAAEGAGHPPVLFLTGRENVSDRIAGFAAGAQDYILKPCAMEELAARVRAHLRLRRDRDLLAEKSGELQLHARLKQDMLDTIVHDLKVPLSSIRGTLLMVRDAGLITQGVYAQLLANSELATDMMLVMINDLLDMDSVEQGGLKPDMEEFESDEVLARLKAMFETVCAQRGIAFSVEPPGRSTRLHADKMWVFRILANLISNAVKFCRPPGEVSVRVERAQDGVRLCVLDRGPGIPDQDKTRIFEKYARLKTVDSIPAPGNGIGLSFCRMASEAMGGGISVSDRPGGGSAFIVILRPAGNPA